MTAYASPAELWIILVVALALSALAVAAVLTRGVEDR